MGLLNKLLAALRRAAPLPDVDWLTNRNEPTDLWPEFVNLRGAPLLLGFNAAARAEGMEGWSDADTLASATETLRGHVRQPLPRPAGRHRDPLARRPFALGSYSYAATGTTPATRAELAGTDWDGRLAFAGEAASTDHPSTVHGAWLSGLDAAALI